MSVTQYTDGGGTTPTIARRVYYTGSDTLYEGYALCYNFDAKDQTAEGFTTSHDGTTISLADSLVPTAARRIQVEKPTVSNMQHFAGTVSEKSDGVTGPGWIEINLPGSVCNVYTGVNCDHEGSAGVNSGQIVTVTANSYTFDYTGLPGTGSATVLGDVDRSSTDGKVQAELMTGEPSGGVQLLISTDMSVGQAVSTGGSVLTGKIKKFGMTYITTAAGNATADITYLHNSGNGAYLGQKKVFYATSLAAGKDVVITISNTTTGGDLVVSLDAAGGESVMLVWQGSAWEVFADVG